MIIYKGENPRKKKILTNDELFIYKHNMIVKVGDIVTRFDFDPSFERYRVRKFDIVKNRQRIILQYGQHINGVWRWFNTNSDAIIDISDLFIWVPEKYED